MGMGMQETVGKHEREGAILVAVAESARGGAGNSATGAGDADKGRGNGITVSPLPTPPSYDGCVESSTGSSSSGGAGNEASASSENGMQASSSEDGSQQGRRRGGGKGRSDRSYHGMHSSISSLTHGSSFGASTSGSSSGSSGGGEGANRSSASEGSSSDVKGNEASQRRDFYVDTDGNARLLWRGADEEGCHGSGSKRRRFNYGDRGMEALLSGAMSLSESSHSSRSGGSSSGGSSGEDGGGGNAHGSGKMHEGGSDVISDLQHHHRRRHHHQRRRDIPLQNDRNSIHLRPAVTESSSNIYDGDGTSSAASRRSTPLCSGGENDGPTDHGPAIVSMRRQKPSRVKDQRVLPSVAANAAHEEKHVIAPPGEASASNMCSVTTADPAKSAAAVDSEEKFSLGPRKTETAITTPTTTKKSKKKKKDAASKKVGSSVFDDDLPSDLVKPKRPMSAYNFFFRDERARIIAEGNMEQADNPTLSAPEAAKKAGATRKTPHRKISFEKLGKIVGQRWRDIDDASLKRYNDMAKADSARYRKEMDAYYKEENAQRRARYMSGLFYKNEVGDDVAAAIARNLNMNASTTTGLALASNIRMTREESQDGAAPTVGAAMTLQQQQPASQALASDNNSGSGSNNQDHANNGVVNSLSARLGGGQQQLGAFQEHQKKLGSFPPNIAAAALQLGLTPLATLGWYTGQSTSTAASKPPNPPQSQVQQQTVPPPQTSVAQYLSLLRSIYGTNVPSTPSMVASPSAQNQLASGSNQPQPKNPSSAAAAEAVRPPAGMGTSETTSQPSPQDNDNDQLPRQNKRRKVTLTAKGSPHDERGSSSSGVATTAAEVCSSLTESNASDSGEAGSNEASSGGSSGSSDNGYDTASGSSDRGPDEGGGTAGCDANVASGSGGGIGIARLHLHDFNSSARRLDDNDNGGIGNMRAVRAVKRSDSASASSDKGYDTASGSSDWRSDMSFVSFDAVHSKKGCSQRQYVVEKNPRKRNREIKKAAFKTQSSSAPPSAEPPHQTDATGTAKRGRPDGQEGRHALIGSSTSGSNRRADRCIRMKECSGRTDVRHSSPANEYETSTSSSMSPSNNQGEKSPAVAYSDRKSPSSPESAAPEQATKGSALASAKSAKQSKTKSSKMTGDESFSKPKRPMSAYNFFFVDEREKILAENCSSSLAGTDPAGRKRSNRIITFEELDKEIGQRWRDIDADTLKKYAYKAEKDAARYRREMSVYYDEKDAQRHSQFLSEIGQGADDRLDTEAELAHHTPRVSNAIRDGHARSESSLTLSAPLTHAAVENMASNNMPSTQELVALLQQRNLLSTSAVVDGSIAGRNLSNLYSGDLALASAVAGVGLAGPSYISTGQIAQMAAPQQSPFAPNYPEILSLLRSNGGINNGPGTQISPNGNGLLLQTTPTAAPSLASLPLDNTLLQLCAAQHGLNPAILQAAVLRQNGPSFSAGFQGSMSNEGA